jgi:hypothetical protein
MVSGVREEVLGYGTLIRYDDTVMMAFWKSTIKRRSAYYTRA